MTREGTTARVSTRSDTALSPSQCPSSCSRWSAACCRPIWGPRSSSNFLLPVGAVCAAALWSGIRLAAPDARGRVLSLLRLVVPFLLGVSGPLALLLIPYAVTGSLGDLYAGILVTPQERLQTTYIGTAGPAAFVFALPVITVFCVCRRRGRGARGLDRAASAAVVVLLALTVTLVGYQIMWYTTAALVPMGILLGVAWLAVSRRVAHVEERPVLFLLLALAAFTSLVQFPFGAPVYLCFVAPLAVLSWVAMFRSTDFTSRLHGVFPLVFLGLIIVFGFVVSHGVLYRMGLRPMSNPQNVILDRGTAWIRVSPRNAPSIGARPSCYDDIRPVRTSSPDRIRRSSTC